MLLFLYFDRVFGPEILFGIPPNYKKNIPDGLIEAIKNLFDSAEPGVTSHYFDEMKVYVFNYFFTVPSPLARGDEEMMMISKIFLEQEPQPDKETFKAEMEAFVKRITEEIPDLYSVCYIKNPQKSIEKKIENSLVKLKELAEKLYNDLHLISVKTYGELRNPDEFAGNPDLHIPGGYVRDIIGKLENDGKKNLFIVYQYRGGRIKIEIIPVSCENVMKVYLVFKDERLTPETILKIGNIFKTRSMELVYTTGICTSDKGRCVYEMYVDNSRHINTTELYEALEKLPGICQIKLMGIE